MLPIWIGLGIAAVVFILIAIYLWIVPNLVQDRITTREVYIFPAADLWKLRVCRYRKGRSQGEPILLVHGAGSNQHNFTTPAGESIVDYLVERGYDCWTVDLRGCYSSTPPYDHGLYEACFDDYLLKDLPPLVQHIRRTTGYGQIHWIGHSLGGMLLYAYVQVFGEKHIASATTMASPIGFEGTNLKFPSLMRPLLYLPRFHGRLQRAYVPIGFTLKLESLMFPINLRNLHPGITRRNLMAMIDLPQPRVLEELMYTARHKVWRVDGNRVDMLSALYRMKVPLFAIFAPRDPFIPVDRARRFVEMLPHEDKQILILSKDNGCAEDYDHCEIPFAKHARREVFEPIERWIAKHPIKSQYEDDLDEEPAQPQVAILDEATRKEILSGDSYNREHPSTPPANALPGEEAPETPALAQTVPPAPDAAVELAEARLPAADVPEATVSPAVRSALASARMQLLAMDGASSGPATTRAGSTGKKKSPSKADSDQDAKTSTSPSKSKPRPASKTAAKKKSVSKDDAAKVTAKKKAAAKPAPKKSTAKAKPASVKAKRAPKTTGSTAQKKKPKAK